MEMLVKLDNVQICESADDWREAVRTSVFPLEQGGYVESCYKEEIIRNVEKLGPYIVIAEDVAMPHARPEQGVNETQVGITLFRKGVHFDGKDTAVRLFVTLAASDNDRHLDALAKISELLSDADRLAAILAAEDRQTLYHYFEHI